MLQKNQDWKELQGKNLQKEEWPLKDHRTSEINN